MDRLLIRDLEFLAYHGVFEEEQQAGTKFTVDLDISWDASEAAVSDELQNAIDYGRVYEIVAHQMATPSQLIEHVAGRIQSALVAEFTQIIALSVRLVKHRPPVVGQFGSVAIELNWPKG